MSTKRQLISIEEAIPRLSEGLLCYLHLWAALHKHVELTHDEIAPDINLWADIEGGYFAVFTQDDPRKIRKGKSYVCALGDDGPVIGQFDQLPSCVLVKIKDDERALLNAMAVNAPKSAEIAWQQIEVIAGMIAKSRF